MQGDGELSFAGGGVVEGRAFLGLVGGVKSQAALEFVGEAFDAGFSVGVSTYFEVEFVGVHEAVSDMDADLGVIDGSSGAVGDGEFGGAGSGAAVDDGDGFRVGGLTAGGGWENTEKCNQGERS